ALYPRELVVYHPRESLERLSAGNYPAVYEECRGAGYAYTISFLDVFFDGGLIFSASEAGLKSSHVQPQILGKSFKNFRTGLRRAGKELVVISPKFPLLVGAAGRFMGFAGFGMQVVDREVAEDKLYFLAVLGLELGQRGKHPSAKRAVKIGELNDGDRRLRRSLGRSAVHRQLGPQHRRRF